MSALFCKGREGEERRRGRREGEKVGGREGEGYIL